jgi:hypothetical protein
MGGLVARAALNQPDTAHVERAVLLGTPHLGSFAPVQALRGTYSVVRKVACLDAGAGAERLAARVFSSFPSLYDMLPQVPGPATLLALRNWPRQGPRPRRTLLQAARRDRAQLGVLDARYTLIAGVGEETVTAIARRGEEFVYTLTRAGDGTVPAASAAPAGAPCLYAAVAHSELTRDAVVAATIADVLRHGRSARLPQRWKNRSRAQARISDAQLRRTQLAKVDWAALQPEERRSFLENLNEPPQLTLRVPVRRRRTTRS